METQHQQMGYDRAAILFSPDGRLLQVEYAEKTVRLGSASVGLICSDGILLIADKRVKDSLMISDSLVKIFEVDNHIAATGAGILSDIRVLVERAQVIAQRHKVTFDSECDIESVMREIANLKQQVTQSAGARPFGVSLMIGGINPDDKKLLFVSDVTGNYLSFKATAIGENDEEIKKELRKKYKESMTINEGLKEVLKIFKKILGSKFNPERFEAAYIKTKEKKFKIFSREEIKNSSK